MRALGSARPSRADEILPLFLQVRASLVVHEGRHLRERAEARSRVDRGDRVTVRLVDVRRHGGSRSAVADCDDALQLGLAGEVPDCVAGRTVEGRRRVPLGVVDRDHALVLQPTVVGEPRLVGGVRSPRARRLRAPPLGVVLVEGLAMQLCAGACEAHRTRRDRHSREIAVRRVDVLDLGDQKTVRVGPVRDPVFGGALEVDEPVLAQMLVRDCRRVRTVVSGRDRRVGRRDELGLERAAVARVAVARQVRARAVRAVVERVLASTGDQRPHDRGVPHGLRETRVGESHVEVGGGACALRVLAVQQEPGHVPACLARLGVRRPSSRLLGLRPRRVRVGRDVFGRLVLARDAGAVASDAPDPILRASGSRRDVRLDAVHGLTGLVELLHDVARVRAASRSCALRTPRRSCRSTSSSSPRT